MIVLYNGKEQEIEYKGSISGLLKKLNVRREETIVKVNGKLVADEEQLKGDEKVEIIKVVFGG